MANWHVASLSYYNIMQANNMSYVRGYICVPASRIQSLVLDYIMKQPWRNYPPLSFNLVKYFPQLDAFVQPPDGFDDTLINSELSL